MNELMHFSRSPNRWADAETRLTPHERFADDIMRIENRERYLQQSRNTQTGVRADLPKRAPLSPHERYASEQSEQTVINYHERRGI